MNYSDCTIAERIKDFNVGELIAHAKEHIMQKLEYIENLVVIFDVPQRFDNKCIQFTRYYFNMQKNDYSTLDQFYSRKQEWRLDINLDCYSMSPEELTQFCATLGTDQKYENNCAIEYNYYINSIDFTDLFINEKRNVKSNISITVSPIV